MLRLHQFLHTHVAFKVFTWGMRALLFLAFLPSGYKKLAGLRFTQIGIDNPVGFFFEALYRCGIYWNFLGFMQLLAGILLLIPRTSTLGALLYLPIVLNILIIVCGMHFTGTPIVVGLMLLANLYLLFWEYPKMKRIVQILFAKS
ncbi:MAG: DoxX family membrane protein [Flavobacterium sp.]|uniref:hypothetical protein n=1 Tax=Flavobacterium sp. TaxID=239 RepID=UPI00121C838C|nr:hypothetical protein [Flavobacterium sp.]RZJ67360.1 MAG: DoxX family membrane protein [Flavobacterium sp.]